LTRHAHLSLLQALAIADDDGTSDRLTAVERELLRYMVNTEHDLVVTAFEARTALAHLLISLVLVPCIL
jgi:hypothetical protein